MLWFFWRGGWDAGGWDGLSVIGLFFVLLGLGLRMSVYFVIGLCYVSYTGVELGELVCSLG